MGNNLIKKTGGKLHTFSTALKIAKHGSNSTSRKKLFFIALLTALSSDFYRKIIRYFNNYLSKTSEEGTIKLQINVPEAKDISIKLRLNDAADYQSLEECFGTHYSLPDMPIDHILDGGANLGFFSLGILDKCNPKEVILVEPNPKNLSLLKFNISALSTFKIAECALTKESGFLNFELAASNTGHLSNSIGHSASADVVQVVTKPIHEVIPNNWDMNKTLIKLDIEGAEYDVLPDMLQRNIKPLCIVGEIHDYLRANGKGLITAMENAGYHVHVFGLGEEGNVCRQFVATR